MYMKKTKNRRRKSRRRTNRRRRRRRRTNRRRQTGGNLWRNFFKEPAFPPGGPYEVGCANLKQGKYYDKLCNPCLPNPKSSVGDMYPGLKGRMKGGKRRRKTRRRRRSRRRRRTRRKRRSRRRRRVQYGGQVGPTPKPLPIKSIIKSVQNGINNFLPSQLVNAGRIAGLDLTNLQHKYYGERTAGGGNPMNQPIGNMKSNLRSLSSLESGDAGEPEEVEEENSEGLLPGKTEQESQRALADSKLNEQIQNK
jgi:hypothetical protein